MTPRDYSKNMTGGPDHAAIRRTHLGQAHIAGTGPEGMTCGDCRFFHLWKSERFKGEQRRIAVQVGRRAEASCNKPIAGKSQAKFPGSALACRLFEGRKG